MEAEDLTPLEWAIIHSREACMLSTALGWLLEEVCAVSRQLREESVQLRFQAQALRATRVGLQATT